MEKNMESLMEPDVIWVQLDVKELEQGYHYKGHPITCYVSLVW